MKKLLAVLLAMLVLVGCTGGNGGNEGGNGGSEVTNQIIYGSTTELNGDMGNAWWGNNASDNLVRSLIDDYAVIVSKAAADDDRFDQR